MKHNLDWAWAGALCAVIVWGVAAWLFGEALAHLAPGGLLAHRVAPAVAGPALVVALWFRLERERGTRRQ